MDERQFLCKSHHRTGSGHNDDDGEEEEVDDGWTDGCIIIHGTRIYTECELLWMMCQLIFYRPFYGEGGEGGEKGAIDI